MGGGGSTTSFTGDASSGAPPPDMARDVEVRGRGTVPGPCFTFQAAGQFFPEEIRKPLLAAGFATPSAIQQYCWPIASAGRDVIGVAKTGSGKTLGFLMPCF